MGKYSEIQIAVTKKGLEKIVEDQEEFADYNLLKCFKIEEIKINNKEIIFMYTDERIRYYREYEDIKQLEKSLSELRDGYVFARFGDDTADIEFRNNAKVKELLEPFKDLKEFVYNLRNEFAKGEEEEEFE